MRVGDLQWFIRVNQPVDHVAAAAGQPCRLPGCDPSPQQDSNLRPPGS
jgi:hypothetical protein